MYQYGYGYGYGRKRKLVSFGPNIAPPLDEVEDISEGDSQIIVETSGEIAAEVVGENPAQGQVPVTVEEEAEYEIGGDGDGFEWGIGSGPGLFDILPFGPGTRRFRVPTGLSLLYIIIRSFIHGSRLRSLRLRQRGWRPPPPAPAPEADPFFSDVVFLLNGPTFVDASNSQHVVNTVGTVGTDAEGFLFDGAGGHLSVPDSDEFFPGNDLSICIEALVLFNSLSSSQLIIGQRALAGDYSNELLYSVTNGLTLQGSSTGGSPTVRLNSSTATLETGRVHHLCWEAKAGPYSIAPTWLYVDGVVVDSDTRSLFHNSTSPLIVGARPDGTLPFTGKLLAARITRAIRYDGVSFTPPLWPLPTS